MTAFVKDGMGQVVKDTAIVYLSLPARGGECSINTLFGGRDAVVIGDTVVEEGVAREATEVEQENGVAQMWVPGKGNVYIKPFDPKGECIQYAFLCPGKSVSITQVDVLASRNSACVPLAIEPWTVYQKNYLTPHLIKNEFTDMTLSLAHKLVGDTDGVALAKENPYNSSGAHPFIVLPPFSSCNQSYTAYKRPAAVVVPSTEFEEWLVNGRDPLLNDRIVDLLETYAHKKHNPMVVGRPRYVVKSHAGDRISHEKLVENMLYKAFIMILKAANKIESDSGDVKSTEEEGETEEQNNDVHSDGDENEANQEEALYGEQGGFVQNGDGDDKESAQDSNGINFNKEMKRRAAIAPVFRTNLDKAQYRMLGIYGDRVAEAASDIVPRYDDTSKKEFTSIKVYGRAYELVQELVDTWITRVSHQTHGRLAFQVGVVDGPDVWTVAEQVKELGLPQNKFSAWVKLKIDYVYIDDKE